MDVRNNHQGGSQQSDTAYCLRARAGRPHEDRADLGNGNEAAGATTPRFLKKTYFLELGKG